MKQDLFKYLPSEIITNILSRLDVRTIASSKCVCKPWLDLLETDDFVNSHLSISVPSLALLVRKSVKFWCGVFELEDEDEVDDVENSHGRRCNRLTKFEFPHEVAIVRGAAYGLLFLQSNFNSLYICNPITRQYVKLSCPVETFIILHRRSTPIYGFGASKVTGQHKVLQIIRKSDSVFVCHVYTLETGSWRRFEATASFTYDDMSCGVFVNGNLHWRVTDSITCFDLETECFSTFYAPPHKEIGYYREICALNDYLCVFARDAIVINIWLMKEYGLGKSWTKEYVIGIHPNFSRNVYLSIWPIKISKDGDILMLWGFELFYYSNKTQTARKVGRLESWDGCINWLLLTPNFLSLKSLGVENVISF